MNLSKDFFHKQKQVQGILIEMSKVIIHLIIRSTAKLSL